MIKPFLSFFFLLSIGLNVFSQEEFHITYGDTAYMKKVYLIVGEDIDNYLERFIMKKGVADGYWKVYYDKGKNKLKIEGKIENGLQEGPWISYSSSGKKSKEINFRKGVLHGEEKYFNSNDGSVLIQYTYSNGSRNGYYFVTHANGKKWQDGYFLDGFPNGTWNYWDVDGKLIKIRTFSKGDLVHEKTITKK